MWAPSSTRYDPIFIGIWIVLAVTLMVVSISVDGTDPWANWDYDPGPWCEAERRSSLMREPANAASDLAFAAVALYQIRCALVDYSLPVGHIQRPAENLLLNYPVLSFISGALNLFHAFGTCMNHSCRCVIGHRFDVVGMCACTLFLVYFQSIRIASLRFWPSITHGTALIPAATAVAPTASSPSSSSLVQVYPHWFGTIIMFVFVIAYLPTITIIWFFTDLPYSNAGWQQREQTLLASILLTVVILSYSYRHLSTQRLPSVTSADRVFIIAIGCLLMGVLLHKADLHRLWCIPRSLLQGHAAWHAFTAMALHCIYMHFRSEHWPTAKRS